MDSPKPPKDVQESALFTKNKAKVTEDTKALDETMSGVIWEIATRPQVFPLEDEALEIRSVECELGSSNPFTVYFKEYEDKIVLLDIEPAKDAELPF